MASGYTVDYEISTLTGSDSGFDSDSPVKVESNTPPPPLTAHPQYRRSSPKRGYLGHISITDMNSNTLVLGLLLFTFNIFVRIYNDHFLSNYYL